MTESKPTTYYFLVYAPDYPDANRGAVRTQHLANAKNHIRDGLQRIGGALIDPATYQSEQKKMIGSAMIYEAENIDAVRKLMEEDVYYTSGVWDKEKLVIVPFNSAFPLPQPPS